MERAKAEGWRFLRLTPDQVESYTPREFTILMRAEQESIADGYEKMAYQAMMTRSAYHAKKLKHSDLYNRDSTANPKRDFEEVKADMRKQQDWLDGLTVKSAEGVRE